MQEKIHDLSTKKKKGWKKIKKPGGVRQMRHPLNQELPAVEKRNIISRGPSKKKGAKKEKRSKKGKNEGSPLSPQTQKKKNQKAREVRTCCFWSVPVGRKKEEDQKNTAHLS